MVATYLCGKSWAGRQRLDVAACCVKRHQGYNFHILEKHTLPKAAHMIDIIGNSRCCVDTRSSMAYRPT